MSVDLVCDALVVLVDMDPDFNGSFLFKAETTPGIKGSPFLGVVL